MRNVYPILFFILLVCSGVFAVTHSLITSSPIVFGLSLIGLASAMFSRGSIAEKWRHSDRVEKLHLFFCSLLVIYLAVRSLVSPVTELFKQDFFLIAAFSIIYIVNGSVINKVRYQKPLVLAIVVLILLNLAMFVPSLNEWRDSVLQYASGTPVSGLFNHRNVFGNLMMMSGLVTASVFLFGGAGLVGKIAWGTLTLGAVVAVMLTLSRGATISLGVGLVVLGGLFIKDRLAVKNIMRTCYLLLGGVLLLGGAYSGYKKVDQMRFENHVGVLKRDGGRPLIFAIASQQIEQAPLFGSGSRSFQYKSYEFWPNTGESGSQDYRFAHNEFLQLVTDYGLIGLLLLGSMMVTLAILSWRVIREPFRKEEGWLTITALKRASLAVTAGMMIHSLVSFPIHTLPNLLIFTVASSWLFLEPKYKPKVLPTGKSATNLSPDWLSLVALSGACFYFVIAEVRSSYIFWTHGVRSDDLGWSLVGEDQDQWITGLEDVSLIAPNSNRLSKLAALYQVKASESSKEERNKLRLAAYDSNLKALVHHPYDTIVMLNLVDHYLTVSELDEAEDMLNKVKTLNVNREGMFEVYFRESQLRIMRSRELGDEPEKSLEQLVLASVALDRHLVESYGYYSKKAIKNNVALKLAISRAYRDLGQDVLADQEFEKYVEFGGRHLFGAEYLSQRFAWMVELLNEAKLASLRDFKREERFLRMALGHLNNHKRRHSPALGKGWVALIDTMMNECIARIEEIKLL